MTAWRNEASSVSGRVIVRGPADLGFLPLQGTERMDGWQATVPGARIHFRLRQSLHKLTDAGLLQREVLGLSDVDLATASGLITIAEPGFVGFARNLHWQ